MSTNAYRAVVFSGLAAIVVSAVGAEEVEKKFRVGMLVGGYHTEDEVRSNSASQMVLVNPQNLGFRQLYEDPRNDGAAIGTLTIEPTVRMTFDGQYAFTKIFLLEASIGYQAGDVGKVEMQGQLDGDFFDTQRERFNFRIFRFTAGEIVEVPIQLTAMWRFRPKTTFNPFFGIGGGYTFVQFEPSSDLNQVSLNMDSAVGQFASQQSFPGAFNEPISPGDPLSGATIEADDFIEWHADAGFEYGFARRWAFVFDLKYTFTSGTFRLRFNGVDQLGVSVPNGEFDLQSPEGQATYGTYYVPTGLVDAGCFVPLTAATQAAFVCVPAQDLATVCPNQDLIPDCVMRFPGVNQVINPADPAGAPLELTLTGTDGLLDPGFYYVRGGDIQYGGPSVHIGLRFTF